MVQVGVHGIDVGAVVVDGCRLVEPTLGEGMLAVVDHTLVIDLFTLVLIGLRREVGFGGIDVPDDAVGTQVVAVDGIPHIIL